MTEIDDLNGILQGGLLRGVLEQSGPNEVREGAVEPSRASWSMWLACFWIVRMTRQMERSNLDDIGKLPEGGLSETMQAWYGLLTFFCAWWEALEHKYGKVGCKHWEEKQTSHWEASCICWREGHASLCRWPSFWPPWLGIIFDFSFHLPHFCLDVYLWVLLKLCTLQPQEVGWVL